MTAMTEHPHVAADGIRSRCPACGNFATEGTPHRCMSGRHRDNFQNPIMEDAVPTRQQVKVSLTRSQRNRHD